MSEQHCCKWHERFAGLPIERCEFCGKDKAEIQYLVAGPRVFICNECVYLSCEMISVAWQRKAEALEEARKKDEDN